jgi:chromosome segregation ATPase
MPSSQSWFESVMVFLSGGGLVALIASLIKKPWTKPEQAALNATATKDEAMGKADMLQAMASTFTDVTGGLRGEIERLQKDAFEMRERAIQFEAELRAALQRVDDLERMLEEKDRIIAQQLEDLTRVRGERDTALERVTQQEGEIRQLKQLIESQSKLQ